MRLHRITILSVILLLLAGCSVNYKDKTVKYFLSHRSEIPSALKWCGSHSGYLGCRNAMRANVIVHNPIAWSLRDVKTPIVTKSNKSLFFKDREVWNGYINYMNTLPKNEQIRYIKDMAYKNRNNLYLQWTFWCTDMLWIDNYTPQECSK